MRNLSQTLKLWLNRVFFGWEFGLTALEVECISRFCDELPGAMGDTVRTQVQCSDALIRFSRGKRTVLQFLSTPIQDVPSFAAKDIELHACTILIDDGRSRTFAEIVFEFGVLVGVEFSRPPTAIFVETCQFRWVRLLVDLNNSTVDAAISIDLASEARPILARIAQQIELTEVVDAAPSLVIETFNERLSSSLPPDFVALLSETNGFSFVNGRFSGSRGRTIPWPNESLVLVAEDFACQWALCFRMGESESGLMFLNEVDAELHNVNGTFADSIAWFGRWLREPTQDLPDIIVVKEYRI